MILISNHHLLILLILMFVKSNENDGEVIIEGEID